MNSGTRAGSSARKSARRVRTPRPLIVHIIDELKVGGAQTHLVTMLRGASRFPFAHRVVSLFGDGPIGDTLRRDGFEVDVLDLRAELAGRRFLGAADAIRSVLREHHPDVVEAHLTWSRLLGLYAAWREGVRRRIGFEQGDVYLDSWKFRAANRVGQVFADRIVVCSEALADWNAKVNGFSRRRMAVMHNCVDPCRFTPSAGAAGSAAGFGLPEGSTVFCAVGTLGRGVNKRVDVAVRGLAAARASGAGVALVVCGDGDQRGELEALAWSLGVGPVVRFLGMRDDVPGVMAACNAFCHAAPFEPFGIVAIEAMAAGLPVVVPAAGGVREAVDDGTTGLLYPALDHLALAGAMARLHDNPALRDSLGRAARKAVEARFGVQGYLTRLYGLYGVTADE